MSNPDCRHCTSDERRKQLENGICPEVSSVADGLPVRCIGAWGYDKIYRLTKYFSIFANGMKNKWDGLNYVEICCGPGRCILKEDGDEIDGTALSILNSDAFHLLDSSTFIDFDKTVVDVLNKRIAATGRQDKATAIQADFTDIQSIETALSRLPSRRLNLALIDPSDCSVPFATIQAVKKSLRTVDLILNIAIGSDFIRNIGNAISQQGFAKAKTKYTSFLGSEGFFQNPVVVQKAKDGGIDEEVKRIFCEEYKQNLMKLGYKYVDLKKVKHYYYLLFATADPRGLDFWKKANMTEPDTQRTLGL